VPCYKLLFKVNHKATTLVRHVKRFLQIPTLTLMLIGTIKNPQILNIHELLISSNFLTGSCIRKCEIYQVVIAL